MVHTPAAGVNGAGFDASGPASRHRRGSGYARVVTALRYEWTDGGETHELRLVHVPGTAGTPYFFCEGPHRRPIEIDDFHIGSTPVTQAMWVHVMGSNPAVQRGPRRPIENVSWHDICGPDGFLDRINANPIRRALSGVDGGSDLAFRLPSETEWEYAARGGPHWTDGFRFSGSNDPDEVAWYGPRWTRAHQLGVRLFGWRFAWRYLGRIRRRWPTRTHDVATRAPNQLGLSDMSGNVWEWCEDTCVDDVDLVPQDGTPYVGPGSERRLRGGCHHNWDLHCTVWWRYGIAPEAHDGCIGFRLAFAPRPHRTSNVIR
jgi:formylglycine-generating enzyme required for sulfatase activity